MKVITLQRPAVCADCGADLPAGTRARYYAADRIYCESHDEKPAPRGPAAREPARTPETRPLFPEDSPDMEVWIQFLEEVQEALANLVENLRRR